MFAGRVVVSIAEIEMVSVGQMHIGEVRLQVKGGLDGGVAQSTSGGSRALKRKDVLRTTGSAVRQSESRIDLNRLVEKLDRISERLPGTNGLPIEFRFADQRFS